MAEINAAWSILGDVQLRKNYDAMHKVEAAKCVKCAGRGFTKSTGFNRISKSRVCVVCHGFGFPNSV